MPSIWDIGRYRFGCSTGKRPNTRRPRPIQPPARSRCRMWVYSCVNTIRSQSLVLPISLSECGGTAATPFNLIEIAAVPPHSESEIGNTSDWLRMVFTHEYTHILHLERAGGWIGRGRRVFGRLPVLHPNLYLPISQIEGIAVFQESRQTGQGRIHAGDFRMIVGRAAAAGQFEPLDRATLWPVDWPSGTLPYAYGGYFNQYLADTYGEQSLAALANATASRVPYLGSGAYKKVYKKSLGELWSEFKASTVKTSV